MPWTTDPGYTAIRFIEGVRNRLWSCLPGSDRGKVNIAALEPSVEFGQGRVTEQQTHLLIVEIKIDYFAGAVNYFFRHHV